MRVTILGNGNVAEAFARAVQGAPGLEPVEIYSRSPKGKTLACEYGFAHSAYPATLRPADIYIMAVSDSAVGEISAQMTIPRESVVAHTAGGIGMEAIGGSAANKAVIYPLQTFTKGRKLDFSTIPVFIEYSTPRAEALVREFAGSISDVVYEADSSMRLGLHIAAVFACNFTNRLYAIAKDLLDNEGLPFDVLKPLIKETAAKAIESSDPASVQTGPAVRCDIATMEAHMEMLRGEGEEEYEKIYEILSKNIYGKL